MKSVDSPVVKGLYAELW